MVETTEEDAGYGAKVDTAEADACYWRPNESAEIGDSMLVTNWMGGIWKIVDPRYKCRFTTVHNTLDDMGMLAINEYCGARETGSS